MKSLARGNFLDLRVQLDTARLLGELKDMRDADARLEPGTISEFNVKIDGAPACRMCTACGRMKSGVHACSAWRRSGSVMRAVAMRADPEIDIDIIRRGMGSKNDPMFVAYRYNASCNSRAIIDACRPYDHLRDFTSIIMIGCADAAAVIAQSALNTSSNNISN